MHAFGAANQTFVKIPAAGQNNLVRAHRLGPRLRECERRVEVMHDMYGLGLPAAAWRVEGTVAGDYDYLAPGQCAPYRFEGFASHEQGLAHGDPTEMFEIARQMPRQTASVANHAIFGDRGDNGERHVHNRAPNFRIRGRGAFLPRG